MALLHGLCSCSPHQRDGHGIVDLPTLTLSTAHTPSAMRVAAIARLPDEILVEIFSLVVHGVRSNPADDDEDDDQDDDNAYAREDGASACAFGRHAQAFKLACIARKWRALAGGAPRLWAAVPLTIRDVRRGRIDLFRHRLVLARSRGTDLDVLVDARMRGWADVMMRWADLALHFSEHGLSSFGTDGG
jgi:hypothetical protein